MNDTVLLVHNVRSSHNVGSLLRTADGLGVSKVYLSGYTPYPASSGDNRLPHIAMRADSQIKKTALGAEASVDWEYVPDVQSLLERLRKSGYTLAALEQTQTAIDLGAYQAPKKIVLAVGSEVNGLDEPLLELFDIHLQIPMHGRKESFNVAVAAAIALYSLTKLDKNKA
jgi:23S rRNA (guanosine2251-2'-O)-methyltransferase